VAKDNWEQGLLGLAFHPDYPNPPYFYVAYTRKSSYKVYVSRFTVDMSNPDVVDGSTDNELELLKIEKTPEGDGVSPVHNGGDLNFGPDGYLYVGFGDGGPDPHFGSTDPHDPGNNGQRTNTLLGKIVRIDVNPNTPGNLPRDCGNDDPVSLSKYSIPPDNPYVGQEGCNEPVAIQL